MPDHHKYPQERLLMMAVRAEVRAVRATPSALRAAVRAAVLAVGCRGRGHDGSEVQGLRA